jgi:iron(II)-dependent oxidoreductase
MYPREPPQLNRPSPGSGSHDVTVTAIVEPGTTATREALARLLTDARRRTLALIAPVSEDDLRLQHSPLMGPIIWDLGHIAEFERLWLGRNLAGPIEFSEMPGLFDPFEHPRASRGELELPTLAAILETLEAVRSETLARLEQADLGAGHPLLRDGYVYRMVAQHEYQHGETILQTLQLKRGAPYAAPRQYPVPRSVMNFELDAMVRFPGGVVTLGSDGRSAAYDSERPRHRRELAPFWIDQTPVTNAAYCRFVDSGGYTRAEWWSPEGAQWLAESQATAPAYWFRQDGEWWTSSTDRAPPLPPDHPVSHVSYYEAEAYARWIGRRLPTEAEWEAAATWDPASGRALAFPWGDEPATTRLANIDQLMFETAPVGAFASNVSPIGCYGMIGDVWEWTSTCFDGYPGFESFPYREYSEAFFGDQYRVLRGGSWATRPGAIRGTFRNWDYPIRRQIFSGFRCARDA